MKIAAVQSLSFKFAAVVGLYIIAIQVFFIFIYLFIYF